jgi:predicted ribosomally synthesized peptide with nif11-like leader
MSQADIERFVRDVQSNGQLRDEVKSNASGLASIVEIAKRRGYDITVDEVKTHMRSQSPKDLSDEQLEALAGGAGDPSVAIISVLGPAQVQSVTSLVAVVLSTTSTSTSTSNPVAQVQVITAVVA